MGIDNVDKSLLNIIQAVFPLSREPFSLLGLSLDIPAGEVIDRISRLKTTGIIRLIGPVLNPRKLGYRTTLVAAEMPAEKLDVAGQVISGHPLVSHCYQRDHEVNLWFTLAAPDTASLEDEVRKLGIKIKSRAILNLPAIKTFKIGAFFGGEGKNSNLPSPAERGKVDQATGADYLSTVDRAIINTLQQDLPLNERPFDSISAELKIDADELLGYCQALLRRGIMRRFSASVNHNKLGYAANAMVCWQVPSDRMKTAGKKVSTFSEVSHCYERQTNSLWPYNLFAMVHAHNKGNCRAVIDRICLEAGLDKNTGVILFSSRELKKTRVRYKV